MSAVFKSLHACVQKRKASCWHTGRQLSTPVCAAAEAAAAQEYRQRPRSDVRVLVVGATGYIGKFVTKELARRGYNVVALSREKSGVGGKQSKEDVMKVCNSYATSLL